MRKVTCRRCYGDGWIATGPALPSTWMPGDEWPADVQGWQKATCPACSGRAEVLTETITDAPRVQQAEQETRPAPATQTTKQRGLFNAQ